MRKRLAALVAAFAALALVAAAQPVQPSGTATTGLVGLTVEVDHVPVPVDVTALDISTSATTVDDPFAVIDALIAEVNGTSFGEFSVRSDGQDSATSSAVTGTILDVSPLQMSTKATDTSAFAAVTASEDVVAAVQLLGDAVLSLEQTGSISQVDADGSGATVGLSVSALDLGLGDLIGDVLADLPLDVLLALANDLLGTVEGLDLNALSDSVKAVEDQLAVIADLAENHDTSAVTASVDALETYVEGLPATPQTIGEDLATVETLLENPGALLTDPSALITLIEKYPDSGADSDVLTDPLATLDDVLEQGEILAGYLGGLLETLTTLQGNVVQAVTNLANSLDAITEAVTTLQSHLQTLLQALEGLTTEAVNDLLEALESAGLVGVGKTEVSLSAAADEDSAEAQLNCVLAGAAVDCLEPVETIDQVVVAAVDTVAGVLETLAPGAVEGDVVLRILGEGSSTSSEGDTNTAEATLEILRLEIPSVNLDALVPDDVSCSAVLDGVLCDLLDGSLETVEQLLATLTADSQGVIDLVNGAVADLGVELGDVDLEAAYSAATGAIAALGQVLVELQTTLNRVLDLILGDLELGLRTPRVKLVVDPTATAAFTPGSAAPAPPTDDGQPAPEPAPEAAPEPEPAPSLPATGGGLALLGVLAMAGGVALRRRP